MKKIWHINMQIQQLKLCGSTKLKRSEAQFCLYYMTDSDDCYLYQVSERRFKVYCLNFLFN